MALPLVGRPAARVVIAVGWRQGDTIHGIRGLGDPRRPVASQGQLSWLGPAGEGSC